MIDLKKAAAIAETFVMEMYPGDSDFEFEEVETSEDGKYWLITIGFSTDEKSPNPLFINVFGNKVRKYKVVQINKETGEIRSMKIRKI